MSYQGAKSSAPQFRSAPVTPPRQPAMARHAAAEPVRLLRDAALGGAVARIRRGAPATEQGRRLSTGLTALCNDTEHAYLPKCAVGAARDTLQVVASLIAVCRHVRHVE